MLPEDLGLPMGFTDRRQMHTAAVEAAKIARMTAAEGKSSFQLITFRRLLPRSRIPLLKGFRALNRPFWLSSCSSSPFACGLTGFGANAIPLGPKKGEAAAVVASTPDTHTTLAQPGEGQATVEKEEGNKSDDDEDWRARAYTRSVMFTSR